jgi:LAO/AO transport system kinase
VALTASALKGEGLAGIWDKIRELDAWRRDSGWFARHRAGQAVRWMRASVERGAVEQLYAHPAVEARLPELESQVAEGTLPPEDAADQVLALFREGG